MKALERKIVSGFATALIVLFFVTAVAWWNVARFRSTHYWVEHTREVLSELERTRSAVLSLQASARGFVLTGSDEVRTVGVRDPGRGARSRAVASSGSC